MKFVSKLFDELTGLEVYEILKSRAEIFLMEQNIHYLDMDNVDYDSLHCFIVENNRVIGYLRAFYTDTDSKIVKIGRVLTLEHGKGIGMQLLEESIKVIKQKMNCTKLVLDSQKYAAGFYEKAGFRVISDEFLEANILHVKMEL
ncbi:MAG: GNAT family N-acetyltransferase [Lachnospiraceae bacterium]|nr:GNAT family N-acetyltransferase [Lachnospiraceae bacterium]